MSTSVDHPSDPLVGHAGDAGLAELRDAFLRARVRDTTVRLNLAMYQARGYAQVWGRDEDAQRWARTAEQLQSELDGLRHRQEEAADEGSAGGGDGLCSGC